jgi:CDP-diacylglycerol--serine O-phosphatidyltransferase
MSKRRPSERLSPADLVTILNAVFGFLAVALLVRHWSVHPAELANGIQASELKLAGALIGCGALCDVADGIVARATWTSRLGDHLDGMADTITFGVAPALLIAVAGFRFSPVLGALALAAATTHIVAVMVRLARHAAAPHAPSEGFVGITSPLGAVGVIGVIALQLAPVLTLAGIFAVSGLMLARFPYPHQTRPAVMVVVVAFVCCGVAVMSGLVSLRLLSAIGLVAIVAVPIVVPAAASARRRPARQGYDRSARRRRGRAKPVQATVPARAEKRVGQ